VVTLFFFVELFYTYTCHFKYNCIAYPGNQKKGIIMNTKIRMLRAFLLMLATLSTLHAFDNFHFYRASYFVGEPRFEKEGLGSFDVIFGAGATDKARGVCGTKTCLLNIHGFHNMHLLGANIPNLDLTNPIDITLSELAMLPANGTFGQLFFKGHFSIQELILQYTQNLHCGFYVQVGLPFRHIAISNVSFTDLSPCGNTFPNATTPIWQTFLSLFYPTMARYGLNTCGVNERGIGDLSAYIGWAFTSQENEVLDFVDNDFKIGVLFPTGFVPNICNVFAIPLGYGGHIGIPLQWNLSFGACNWMTLGGHLGAIAFLPKTRQLHLKTDINQNGFIKLAQGCAEIQRGALWHTGVYFKADHVCRGFSFLMGYTYAQQRADVLCPSNSTLFDATIVNSDTLFKGWNMSTLNFIFEYDFTQEYAWCGPRAGLFYNAQIAGKRTFDTSIAGATFGLDICWDF
jgi:hypothetical protein